MKGHVGDRIVVESERVAQPSHTGVIEEVLQEEPLRYLVEWEDGRTSAFTPNPGAAKIEPKKQRAKRRSRPAAPLRMNAYGFESELAENPAVSRRPAVRKDQTLVDLQEELRRAFESWGDHRYSDWLNGEF